MCATHRSNTESLTRIVEGLALVGSEELAPLRQMRDMQAAYRVLLQYEAERLKRAYGDNDPRVLEMKNRLRRNLALIEKLEVEDQLRQIRVRETGEKESLVHGRVTDEGSRGLAGFTVALTDRDGKDLGIPEAGVDFTGYFAVVVPEELAARLASEKTRVYLTIKNRKGELCERRPVSQALGGGVRVSEAVMLSKIKRAGKTTESRTTSPPKKPKSRKK